jgi:hypothetical protein
MAVDMFHPNEIAAALRRIVQGMSPLTTDVEGGDTVQVRCSRLFAPGAAVWLRDRAGQVEEHTVAGRLSLTEVQLSEPIEGTFRVSEEARLQLREGVGAQLKWVAQGRPELMPLPHSLQLPAVVIEPGVMVQPMQAGTNRTYEQEYNFGVYFVRRDGIGEQGNEELLAETGELFNLLMSDPYLEDSCWHAQVTRVDLRPEVEAALRKQNPGVQVVRLEVLAKRSEVWGG